MVPCGPNVDSNEETLPRPLRFDTSAALAAHLARQRGSLYGKRLSPWGQLSHGGTWTLFLFTCWKLCLSMTKKTKFTPKDKYLHHEPLWRQTTFSFFPVAKSYCCPPQWSGIQRSAWRTDLSPTWLVMLVPSLPVLSLFSVQGRKGGWSILSRAGFLQFFCLFLEIPSSVSRSFKHTNYAPVWSKSTL